MGIGFLGTVSTRHRVGRRVIGCFGRGLRHGAGLADGRPCDELRAGPLAPGTTRLHARQRRGAEGHALAHTGSGFYRGDPGPEQTYTGFKTGWYVTAACRGDGGYLFITVVQQVLPDGESEWYDVSSEPLETLNHNAGGYIPPDENNCRYWFGFVSAYSSIFYIRATVMNNNCCTLPGTGCVKQPTTDDDTGFCDE